MFHSVSLFVFLYLFWLLLSGFFTPFLLSAGGGCALAVVWFARRMDVVDAEGHPIHLGPKGPKEFLVHGLTRGGAQAANTVGTVAMLLLAVMGFLDGRPEFLDLAIVYGLLNVIGTIAEPSAVVQYRQRAPARHRDGRHPTVHRASSVVATRFAPSTSGMSLKSAPCPALH